MKIDREIEEYLKISSKISQLKFLENDFTIQWNNVECFLPKPGKNSICQCMERSKKRVKNRLILNFHSQTVIKF